MLNGQAQHSPTIGSYFKQEAQDDTSGDGEEIQEDAIRISETLGKGGKTETGKCPIS
jgi:hypothetical protein